MLLSFIISSIFLAISPGPDNIYLTTLTIRSGKFIGFSFLSGLLIGCLIHTILLSIGLNALVVKSDYFFEVVKYLGAIYLLFLAIKVFYVTDFSEKFDESNKSEKFINNFKRGVLMNLLNPKVFIFFAVFFPNFIFTENISIQTQIIILGLIFIIITLIIFSSIIIFSNILFKKISQNPKLNLIAKYFNILILLSLSIIILFTENNITLD